MDIGTILEEADIKPHKIEYYCENRDPDFDSKMHTKANLANGWLQNGFVRKNLPLDEIIDLSVTPHGSKAAHRLNLQSIVGSERCVIKSITLE